MTNKAPGLDNLTSDVVILQEMNQLNKKPEPGIRHGNEDSCGNENRKSWKHIFSVEKSRKSILFCLWKLRWWICECKLKAQNYIRHEFWYTRFLQMCLQKASNCSDFSLDFQNFPGGWGRGVGLGGWGEGGRACLWTPLEISSFFFHLQFQPLKTETFSKHLEKKKDTSCMDRSWDDSTTKERRHERH